MACYKKIANLLQQHFNSGEYPEGKYPSLRKIAADMGCSYKTALRAMHYLKEQDEQVSTPKFPIIAMITPCWRFTAWHRAVRECVLEAGGQVRFVTYSTEIDPVITQTINEKFDLIFLYCPVEPGTPLFKVIQKNKARVIVLFQDLTQYGIRCINGAPEETIIMIMKDLAKYNIRHIDMIGYYETNALPIRRKMWEKGLQQIKGKGEFFSYPHISFNEEPEECYHYLKEHFDRRKMPDAFFCINSESAQGLYRYLFDLDLFPGKDVSVFAFGDAKIAAIMAPPLASTVDIGLKEMIKQVISEYTQKTFSSTKMFKLTEQVYYKGLSLVPSQLKDTELKKMRKRRDESGTKKIYFVS